MVGAQVPSDVGSYYLPGLRVVALFRGRRRAFGLGPSTGFRMPDQVLLQPYEIA